MEVSSNAAAAAPAVVVGRRRAGCFELSSILPRLAAHSVVAFQTISSREQHCNGCNKNKT